MRHLHLFSADLHADIKIFLHEKLIERSYLRSNKRRRGWKFSKRSCQEANGDQRTAFGHPEETNLKDIDRLDLPRVTFGKDLIEHEALRSKLRQNEEG